MVGDIVLFEAKDNLYNVKGSKFLVSGIKSSGDKTVLSPLDKFLIAFQADGSFFSKRENEGQYTGARSNTFPVRFNLKKPRKIERLSNILDDLGWEYKKTNSKSREGYVDFYIKTPIEIRDKISKYFKDWVNLDSITNVWGLSFIEELKHWDGKATGEHGIGYCTIVEENADIVQAISHLSGCKDKLNVGDPNKVRGNRQIGYDSNIVQKTTVDGRGVRLEEVQYDGTVHCVSVPTKMLVVRRNKVVAICGNTEHSVMSSHGLNELETFRYLIEDVYPTGFVSIVSDTYDFWKNVTETLPELRSKIMARDGKVVIRPDSGDPVKIICGDPNAEPNTAEYVGLIESLWVIFGGKVNSKGYKVLDPHIGAIYGDSITLDRAEEIFKQLKAKGFASSNIVYGVGSYTYQMNTRDTFGFAVKSTYSIVNGEERFLFKDPKTDDGTKRSQRGMVAVLNNGTEFKDGLGVVGITDLYLENELSLVFNNGELKKHFTLDQIRENVDKELELQ